MKKWKTIDTNYIFKTPFGNLRRDRCELPNGNRIDEYYVHEYSDWVNAIVVTEDNQVVLVEQFRYPSDRFFLEIPAGKKEENETNEEAILREVREETGFSTNKKPILIGEFWVNPATQTNKVISYLITDAYKASDQNLDDNEEITVHLVDLADMEKMIHNQKINQLFTVSAYYMAKDLLKDL
jgi:ADP-ribose pyrophosphatase